MTKRKRQQRKSSQQRPQQKRRRSRSPKRQQSSKRKASQHPTGRQYKRSRVLGPTTVSYPFWMNAEQQQKRWKNYPKWLKLEQLHKEAVYYTMQHYGTTQKKAKQTPLLKHISIRMDKRDGDSAEIDEMMEQLRAIIKSTKAVLHTYRGRSPPGRAIKSARR